IILPMKVSANCGRGWRTDLVRFRMRNEKKYTGILRDRANGIRDNSAETFLFLEGIRHTNMASDPLMWAAMQLYAFEPVRLWADITHQIEYEDETTESIFGDEIPSRFSHAFGKITLLTEGITDSR